jgi:cytochrome c553
MVNHRVPIIFGALIALAAPLAAPANGADAIETKLQICATCHGVNGEPINVTIPIIWGQQEYFLVKQLHDYKSHDRDSNIMAPMAEMLTQELRPAAAYFAKKAGRRGALPLPPHRLPTGWKDARFVTNRILSVASRRRGSRARATNIWSKRCGALPKGSGRTTSTW